MRPMLPPRPRLFVQHALPLNVLDLPALTIVNGAPGMGKSWGTQADLLGLDPNANLLACDPQGPLAALMASYDPRGLFEQLDREPGIPVLGLFESTGSDKWREDQRSRERHREFILTRRGYNEIEHALLLETLDVALELLQYQSTYTPYYWLGITDHLINNCTVERVQNEARRLLWQSLQQQMFYLGPLRRLLKPIVEDASVIARSGDIDPLAAIDRNKRIYIVGGDASDAAIYTMISYWINSGVHYVRRFKKPLLIIVDEASNWGIPGIGFLAPLLTAIKTLRKYGLRVIIIVQSIHSLDEEIRAQLLDCAGRIVTYGVASPETAKIMAQIMTQPNLLKVQYVEKRKRQVHKGWDHQINVSRRLGNRDEEDSITEAEHARPIYEIEEDEVNHYVTLSDQDRLTASEIMNLAPMERYVREGNRVWREKVPLLPPPRDPGAFERFVDSMRYSEWFKEIPFVSPPIPALKRGKNDPGKNDAKPSKGG